MFVLHRVVCQINSLNPDRLPCHTSNSVHAFSGKSSEATYLNPLFLAMGMHPPDERRPGHVRVLFRRFALAGQDLERPHLQKTHALGQRRVLGEQEQLVKTGRPWESTKIARQAATVAARDRAPVSRERPDPT
jgi:hypothetical protein